MNMPVTQKRTKRSSKVALTTMVAIGGGAMLSACGGDGGAPAANAAEKEPLTEVQVFENTFACAKVTGKSPQECEQMRTAALDEAKKDAPRFAALRDCEAQFGQGKCVENEDEATEEDQPRRRYYSGFVAAWFSKGDRNTPLFSSKRGGYQTANGTRLGFAGQPGKYFATNRAFERAKSVAKVKPASKAALKAMRGGFGGRSSSGWALADRDGKRSKSSGGSSSARSKGG